MYYWDISFISVLSCICTHNQAASLLACVLTVDVPKADSPSADTAVFCCQREHERGFPNPHHPHLCSGSLQAQSGQWKNPHPDRYLQADIGHETEAEQKHKPLPGPHSPPNVLR